MSAAGVAVGDTFRRVTEGPESGRVCEVTEVHGENVVLAGWGRQSLSWVNDTERWERVGAVELSPVLALPAVDPLFAELLALEANRGDSPAVDDARDPSAWLGYASEELDRADSVIGDPDGGGDAVYRDALMRATMFCLAAVRVIDRTKVSP